ncbi:MAG TPA: hypothetical protein VET46_04270 [Steroidobacteraceae bacterium]|nr:hypothetical protein [Steroidobacteraceae bacterium]
MLKSFAIGACLALLAGCATTPTTPAKPATAAATLPAGCVGQTASRIPVRNGECAGFGSTYTQQDIDRTGQPTAGPALQMLDPSVRVGH